MNDLELFDATGVQLEGRKWKWYASGRYLMIREYGWSKIVRKREVWHFDGECTASSEAEAEAIFLAEHGERTKHNQWGFIRGEEIKPPKSSLKTEH